MVDDLTARPPEAFIGGVRKLMAPWKALNSPFFLGMENVPEDRPLLLVGNHTIYGMLDAPFLALELFERHGIWVRSLGDHIHFKVPGWGAMLRRYGVVDGTRENCDRLMEAGEAILVFPGGAREVAKRKGEKYQLIWKERLGFVRMALKHGCTIIPFSALGVEDGFDIMFDADDLLRTPLGGLLRLAGVREDIIWPISRGIGPTPLPRPQRFYFDISAPIRTAPLQGQQDDDEVCWTIREEVQASIEAGLDRLRAYRRSDPQKHLVPRLIASAGRLGGADKGDS